MTNGTAVCPQCARKNRSEAAYCDGCGTALPKATRSDGREAELVADTGDAFFGRERELKVMDGTLEQVLGARGRILVLSGDIGIGKTRTAQVLARHAEQRDIQVLWGRCYEEPGAPPYWPWLQLIRGYLATHDDERLRAAMGPGTNPIAEIVPELAARLADVMPAASAHDSVDASQARFRLFDAITSFLRRASALQPLLLIFDNMHWADAPSLRLLEFVAAEIADARLVLLGTYRDIELSRHHPLSDTLGELARHSWFQRVRLSGLSQKETERFMGAAAGQAPPQALLTAVHAQTEGNPLFVAEMTRFLVQEGVLGSTSPAALPGGNRRPLPRRIPEGVREVIGTRLNRLSKTCNRLLAVAAVIGRSFGQATLFGLLDDVQPDERSVALEEALQASILEELPEPGGFQFSHALIRETLYEELPAPRRARLHLAIAEALEKRPDGDPMAWLSALAHHYCAALPGGDPSKAIEYARRAAEHANRLFAFEEAVRLYRLALQALEGAAAEQAALRLRLFIALGDALIKAGENVQALQILQDAAGSAKALGLAEELARAARTYEGATWRPGFSGTTAAQLLSDALAGLPERDSVLRSEVMSSFARALIFSGQVDKGLEVSAQAIAMARRVGDPSTLACALRSALSARWRPELIRTSLANAAEAMRLSEAIDDKDGLLEAASWRLFDLLEIGDCETLAREFAVFVRETDALRQPFYHYGASLSRATFALFHGEFAACERYAAEALERGRRMPSLDVAGIYGVQMFSLRREQGRLKEVAPLVTRFVRTTPRTATWRPGLAIIYAELGLRDEARAEFEELATERFGRLARDGFFTACLSYLAEVCAFLEDAERAADLYRLLAPLSGRNVVASPNVACYGSADRFLGLLSTTLERWSDAERHYEAALELNARQEAWPWLAHTHYAYAAMLFLRGRPEDRIRADQLLKRAIERSRALGMAALLARAETRAQKAESSGERRSYPAGLSPREVEVLRLVASGKGNREIAKRLFVSPNTIANHVRSILTKTNTANRTEAAAFAIRHDLVEH